jgi:hypothetical protein
MHKVYTFTLALFSAAAVLGAQSPYTHYVTPDGSSTGVCSEFSPCNLYRASQFPFPAGSVVRVAAGDYSQGQLTFARSGTADARITFMFEAGARTSGTRIKPTDWAPVEGYPHVFETPWDEAVWPVGTVAQRDPQNWRPILVDDRAPPFTVSQGRPFTLDTPPIYKQVWSLPAVESQSGTFMASAAQDKVYVHTYHDGQPTPEDDLYIAPANWGSIRIEGDYLTFDGLTVEKTSGTGLHVRNSSSGVILRHITARSAQVWIEGWSTLLEDYDISHVIKQGDVGNEDAYDANPDFGMGEAWQGEAKGDALLVGRQATSIPTGNVARRGRIHRSWNLARIDGSTLEDSWLWGAPNHALQASGRGVVLRNNTIAAAQDALYMEGNWFDEMVVEGNAFLQGVLVWASRDGRPVGVAPTTWRFFGNILPSMVMDDRTFPAAQMDCNAYIPKQADSSRMFRVTSTVGGSGRTFGSVADVRASTTLEQRSIELPYTFWGEGRAFRSFVNQADEAFDLSDPLKVCGERVGPRGGTE